MVDKLKTAPEEEEEPVSYARDEDMGWTKPSWTEKNLKAAKQRRYANNAPESTSSADKVPPLPAKADPTPAPQSPPGQMVNPTGHSRTPHSTVSTLTAVSQVSSSKISPALPAA